MPVHAPRPVQFDYVYTNADGDTVRGTTILDASISEQHTTAAEVTRHQVERGSDVTDHIRPLPKRLSVEGLITNTPIVAPAKPTSGVTSKIGPVDFTVGEQKFTTQALQFSSPFDRVLDVYGELVAAASFGALFTVTTTLQTYENLAISNFAVPRNAGLGNALRFSVDFSEIRIVDTVTVAALPSEKKATKRQGAKPTKEVDEKSKQGEKSSFAFKLVHGS